MSESTPEPAPGDRYRHFKGGVYEVLLTAKHSETDEQLVVYRPEGSGQWWARPLAMFAETVQHEGRSVRRFEPVSGD